MRVLSITIVYKSRRVLTSMDLKSKYTLKYPTQPYFRFDRRGHSRGSRGLKHRRLAIAWKCSKTYLLMPGFELYLLCLFRFLEKRINHFTKGPSGR